MGIFLKNIHGRRRRPLLKTKRRKCARHEPAKKVAFCMIHFDELFHNFLNGSLVLIAPRSEKTLTSYLPLRALL